MPSSANSRISSAGPVSQVPPKSWMTQPACTQLQQIYADAGFGLRFVGGCVRDTLLGRTIRDIDLCTPARPEQSLDLLEKHNIKTIPTGLSHGTITAVIDKKPFEITTLRLDLKTDGRHADVTFTENWQEDAARRDFTMNALSFGADYQLWDYFGGLKDLRKGCVRFIGDPNARIQEDYLRILRFFRFYASYGRTAYGPTAIDQEGLKACQRHAEGMTRLSRERIAVEIKKLLSTPTPAATIGAMFETGVLTAILHHLEDRALPRLSALNTLEAIGPGADPWRRLAALLKPGYRQDEAERLKLSNKEKERFAKLDQIPALTSSSSRQDLNRCLYRYGPTICLDTVLLQWADQLQDHGSLDHNIFEAWQAQQTHILSWEAPLFPLSGKDALSIGLQPGPALGRALAQIEDWWIEKDFQPNKMQCLEALEQHHAKR